MNRRILAPHPRHYPVSQGGRMTVFELSNLLVLPFWVLMVLVPTWA